MTKSRTPTGRSSDAPKKSPSLGESPAVRPPAGYDHDWRERIETARRARDQARKARGDRPVVFRHPRFPV